MVHEQKLSAVLGEFARTMATDFPIQGILEHLVRRIVEVLPISSAGVTLISPGRAPRYVAASDQSALRYEQLQTEIGEGPCLAAYESGESVTVADLAHDERFSKFRPVAVQAGLGAVFTFPLRHDNGRLGALDLYRDTPGELDQQDLEAAQTLADVATAYLLNAQAREEARSASDLFRHSALHDPLTGLANRMMLEQRLEHAARRAQRSHTKAAILFADIDRFKSVNDNHGHAVGDKLLVAVAQRLSALIRPADTLARVSGDEFVLLCEDMRSTDDVEILARRIDASFVDPFVFGDLELNVTASVGVAFAGPGEDISEQHLAQADTAMYQAKRKGGAGHQLVDVREATQADDRALLERELRSACLAGELSVAYQPIVSSADGRVTGVEALLRWAHPERGDVPAHLMVAIAEQSGLITEIGAWVLERSCRDRQQWLADHPETPLELSVNVSTRQMMGPGFCATVADVMTRTGADPTAVVLEMTENVLVEDSERAKTVLVDLKKLGVRIALDDFGTGFSSLSFLRGLPIDILKIDQGFTADIGHAPTGTTMVAAMTGLAHALGLSVTAEGVETQTQCDEVREIGCEQSQGYFYARPMPAAAISGHLDTMAAPPWT